MTAINVVGVVVPQDKKYDGEEKIEKEGLQWLSKDII
jgi:hypothetical protein